ncbi:endocuticle structural glycoprotein SgAbd-2-like [Periplaneta americana]|uniref:endocuticle structural glycoprotein SgAbd-2-like n=1 Tax=Periplaneta americana TaxID=6978 RepID=UPI0037E81438
MQRPSHVKCNSLGSVSRALSSGTTGNMKLLICLSAMLVICVARPQYYPQHQQKQFVPILAYNNDISHDGSYAYSFQTGDGTTAQESGYLKNAGSRDLEAQTVQGSYSYTSPEGTPITVTYTADENGFRAEGAHLPVAPPIPEAILKSLELIARTQPGASANLGAYAQQGYNRQQYRY